MLPSLLAAPPHSHEHDDGLASTILSAALRWRDEDQTGGILDLPLDSPGFDPALHAAIPALQTALGDQVGAFLRDVHWSACNRIDRGSVRGGAWESEFVFVPFVAEHGNISSVTGDLEKTVGFADAYDASGYSRADDFIVFFPHPVRLEWLLARRPGALRQSLNGLVASLLARTAETEARAIVAREAFGADLDPLGAIPPGDEAPCVRALIGLHIGPAAAAAAAPRPDAHAFIAALDETYPSLSVGQPGELFETAGRMLVMDMVEQWIEQARDHGLSLALGETAEPWDQRIEAVHIYTGEAEIHVVAELPRTLLGPIAFERATWPLVEPEIVTALETYAPRIERHDRAFSLPRTAAH